MEFDIERMKDALASPSIEVPKGMSREEKRAFFISRSNDLTLIERLDLAVDIADKLVATVNHIGEILEENHKKNFADQKYVRVMCDYCATGIWAKNGGSEEVDNLPVNAEVIARLDKWQAVYDLQDCFIEQTSKWDLDFMQEGLSIACEIKRQLPDWTVMFYNENNHFPYFEDDGRRNIEVTDTLIKYSEVLADFDANFNLENIKDVGVPWTEKDKEELYSILAEYPPEHRREPDEATTEMFRKIHASKRFTTENAYKLFCVKPESTSD